MTLVSPHQHTCRNCGEQYRSNNQLGDIHCYQCQEKAMEPLRLAQDNWIRLSDYLKQEIMEGKREFRISFHDDKKFIIHPMGKDGKTEDFSL